MVHALRSTPRPTLHPDAKRIAGMAAAILLNAGFLMLLLVPMRGPPSLSLPDTPPVLQWIVPKPDTPPVPPIHVPVTRSHPTTVPQHATQPRAETQAENPPILVEAGGQPTIQPPGGEIGPKSPPDDIRPIPGVRLEYADAPAPAYPRDALRDGAEGTVLLQVLVDVDGHPLQVDVQRSSGDRRLDLAARKQVLQHWRFRPAMRDGQPVQAIGLVPVAFSLEG